MYIGTPNSNSVYLSKQINKSSVGIQDVSLVLLSDGNEQNTNTYQFLKQMCETCENIFLLRETSYKTIIKLTRTSSKNNK